MLNVSPSALKTAPVMGAGQPVLVGFSVRSLVEAVVALGWQPVAVDHFTDQDCRELAFAYYQVAKWSGKPPNFLQFPEFSQKVDSDVPCFSWTQHVPWALLGGGTENWPELVASLHQNFKVLGPTTGQLKQLRSLAFWRQSVAATGIRFPPTLNNCPPHRHPPHRRTTLRVVTRPRVLTRPRVSIRPRVLPAHFKHTSTSWLVKPTRGAGGQAIARLPKSERFHLSPPTLSYLNNNPKNSPRKVYQREILGRSLGAYCILRPNDVSLLGVTESLPAQLWPGPSEFTYRGSWGPVSITAEQQTQIKTLCLNIQAATGMLGWLQLDFVEDQTGGLWLLELNPRWTAGMEILFLSGINPVAFHLAAWDILQLQLIADDVSRVDRLTASTVQYAKAIVYADSELSLTSENLARLHALPRESFADLPASDMAGQTIRSGHPLLTVRARCESNRDESQTRLQLLQQLQNLRATALGCL